jgi:hypothetical protein
LLKPLGSSLKTNVKRLIGKVHPQRDRQYRVIQRLQSRFLRCGDPIIRMDAKTSERIGPFKNVGARDCRTADVVNTDDFPRDAPCRATLDGVDDPRANHALVSVGTVATTAPLAVASIRHWWESDGRGRDPNARHLLMEADTGGCNGHRPR